ncbi:hypothetical protein EBH_0024400 [Eimeria brunetti]|uniref:Uncharacterized protein n=1 Tax=Eimeria brunetti TaxID=51314 RepID=U6LZX1_9EIME|nr:hypothetical protein EBH_0024400 [Eimeria brunetti]
MEKSEEKETRRRKEVKGGFCSGEHQTDAEGEGERKKKEETKKGRKRKKGEWEGGTEGASDKPLQVWLVFIPRN